MSGVAFVKLLEYLAIAIFVALVVTQLLVPAWRGQKLFPWFRKQGELESELADVVQKNQERKLKATILKLKRKRK